MSPVYVSSTFKDEVTVAWYTKLLVRHFPSKGQVFLTLQLHCSVSGGVGLSFLNNLELCEEMFFIMFEFQDMLIATLLECFLVNGYGFREHFFI